MPTSRLLRIALALCVLGATACVTPMPIGTSFDTVEPAPMSLDRGAWLARAEVSDPNALEVGAVEHALTLSLARYIGDARYFARVNQLPGVPDPDELVLHFDFDRYQLQREQTPNILAASMLTLSFYLICGGPAYWDHVSLAAQLRIEDAGGHELVRVHGQVDDAHRGNVYAADLPFPSAIAARTKLVRSLLQDALGQLATAHTARSSP